MNQQHILSDISTLTRVPNKIMDYLSDMAVICITSAISDAKLNQQDKLLLNIGIGTLAVDLISMEVKFIPGKELKKNIRAVVSGEEMEDPVITYIGDEMVKKLCNICEEVV